MEECFLAGLLHDIGRFVIFEHRPQEMAQLDEADVTSPQELVRTFPPAMRAPLFRSVAARTATTTGP
jgi:HD-like signal output (HDOD) protein